MDRIGDFLNGGMNSATESQIFSGNSDWSPAAEAVFFSTEKSQGKAIGTIAEMDKAIATWIDLHEKDYAVLTEYLGAIPKTDNTEEAQLALAKEMMNKFAATQNTVTGVQIRGWDKLFDKNAGSRFFQRADFKQQNVQSAEMELVKKCQTGGVYRQKVDALAEKFNSLGAKIEMLANKCKDETYRMKGVGTLARMYNSAVRNLGATIRGSMNRGVLRLDSSKPFPITGQLDGDKKANESFSDFLAGLYGAD